MIENATKYRMLDGGLLESDFCCINLNFDYKRLDRGAHGDTCLSQLLYQAPRIAGNCHLLFSCQLLYF